MDVSGEGYRLEVLDTKVPLWAEEGGANVELAYAQAFNRFDHLSKQPANACIPKDARAVDDSKAVARKIHRGQHPLAGFASYFRRRPFCIGNVIVVSGIVQADLRRLNPDMVPSTVRYSHAVKSVSRSTVTSKPRPMKILKNNFDFLRLSAAMMVL